MTRPSLSNLFVALADLLDEGSEPIAAIGSAALRRYALSPCPACNFSPANTAGIANLLRSPSTLPCARELTTTSQHLPWYHSGYENGRINPDVALRMLTVELIGRDGLIFEDSCRVGLFVQFSNTNYITRTHSAEELFVQIAGEGEWFVQGSNYVTRRPGDRMHHASYQPHASRTTHSGLLALWVWAGEISFDSYQYAG